MLRQNQNENLKHQPLHSEQNFHTHTPKIVQKYAFNKVF